MIDMCQPNKASQRENYPLPIFDNFMTKLRGVSYFSLLDLKNFYNQLELAESRSKITIFIIL